MINARTYTTLPQLPVAGLLERYMDTLGVIVPVARTNEILNPSGETNTTGYTAGAGSLARSTTQQYHGAYSFAYTPSAAVNDGFFYGTISTTAGQTRAVSCKFLGVAGVPYKLSVATTGGVDLVTKTFIGTGYWQWTWLFFTETSTTTRRIYFAKNNSANTGVFYVDGVQSEVCGSEGVFVTTYIDGDQQGYLANQFPPAYVWSGTPHASPSTRSGQTRAGGRIMRWVDLGFLLTTIIGLGLATPRNEALGFAQLDGADWQNTIKPERSVSFVGRWNSDGPTGMQSGQARLGRFIDRDRIGTRQPLVLCLQAQACGESIGELLTIPRAVYASGLDGTVEELPTAAGNVTFQQYVPFMVGRDGGAALDVQDSIASPGGILARAPNGTWSALGAGVSGGEVRAIAVGANGLVYVGGSFTDAGGTGADFIASYNPLTGTWAVLGSATALNAAVEVISIGPDGRVYVGGSFTNASGIAAADFIAVWDPVAASWAALSTGMNSDVLALAWVGNTLYAGGNFTTPATRVAAWNGSAWSALGSGANDTVWALAAGPGNILYIGGEFTNGGGVAAADMIGAWVNGAWVALSMGMDLTVNALAVGLNGLLYAGGIFTTAGGITAAGIAMWNGVQWQQVGSGFSSPGTATPSAFAVQPTGTLLITSNFPVVDAGTPGYVFQWNGSAYVSLGLEVSGGEGTAIAVAPDGTVYAGVNGTNVAAGLASVVNNGTVITSPQLVIRGPSSGTSRIYEVTNRSTGKAIYFNYTIAAGETLTLTFDPQNLSFVSSFRGNIYYAILPGSQVAQFALQPGANAVTFLAASSTVTAALQWPTRYASINDALYQASGD